MLNGRSGQFCLAFDGAVFGPVQNSWFAIEETRGSIPGARAELLLPSGDVVLVGFGVSHTSD
jgi:hypothetical protein